MATSLIRSLMFVLFLAATSIPSFAMDCKKAKTKLEKTICGSSELKELDEKLNKTYADQIKSAHGGGKDMVKRAQKFWHGQYFLKCADAACIKKSLEDRIQALKSDYDDRKWLSKYKGSNTNALMYDPLMVNLLAKISRNYSADFGLRKKGAKSEMIDAIAELLSGPPDDLVFPDPQHIVITGCRAQSCDEKGFIWLELEDEGYMVVLVHHTFNGKYDAKPQIFVAASGSGEWSKISVEAKSALTRWLSSKEITPSLVRVLTENGAISEVKL